ncbi:CHAT domain-containing protein [Vibrio lentus]
MNATEVFMSHEELVKYRCDAAVPNIFLLNTNSLVELIRLFEDHPFVFITCIGKELEFVRGLDVEFKYPPFVVGLNDEADVNISEYDIFAFDDLIQNRFHTALENSDLDERYSTYIKDRTTRERVFEVLDTPSRSHAITRPNEAALLSLGYRFKETDRLIGSADKSVFIDAMIKSSRDFNEIISQKKDDPKSDLIVYSPSIFTHLYDFRSNFWNQLGRQINNKKAKQFIMDSVFKNPHYSGSDLHLKGKEEFHQIMGNKTVPMLLQTRQFELAYSTLAMESLAIAYVCPVVRLPNSINFHNSKLRELETLSASVSHKAMDNLNRKYKLLSEALKNEIGAELVEFIAESDSLTICSDAPVEWITFKKIPLMFTHEISKIHTTPGNQLLKTATNFSNITLDHEDLLKVTVIRSFKEYDPIKYTLATGLQTFAEIDNKVELIIVDVDSREQLIEELNKVQTPILIFDCHGNHGGSDSNGWLQIGDDKVDTWNLPCKGTIPPIVILSACLTSAVGGSHASVANGLLGLGALSVLGTLLPVDANKAAAFVGRIILRLTGFLNALKKMNVKYLTWRKFISDFFKMSFCTDVLTEFRDSYGWISDKEYKQIHLEVNYAINSFKPDWLEVLISKVAESSGNDCDSVQRAIDEIGFVETMNYLQVGRPENIIIDL